MDHECEKCERTGHRGSECTARKKKEHNNSNRETLMNMVELNESTDVYNNDVESVSELDLSAYSQCNKTEEEEILDEIEYLRMAKREEERLGEQRLKVLDEDFDEDKDYEALLQALFPIHYSYANEVLEEDKIVIDDDTEEKQEDFSCFTRKDDKDNSDDDSAEEIDDNNNEEKTMNYGYFKHGSLMSR